MYTMEFDFAFLVFVIIGLIASAFNKAREKSNKGVRKNVQPKMTPAEILEKLNQYKAEKNLEPVKAEVRLTPEEIREKKEIIRAKHEAEKIAKREARKKRRQESNEATVVNTLADERKPDFSHQDWRRAIITKEILDKPKALRNDLY